MAKTSGVSIVADFSALAQTIGAGLALSKCTKDTGYVNAIINNAKQTAENEFNREAVAAASAGAGIKHMFEWGTAGINRGKTNIRPNPFDERARLWKNIMTGSGLNHKLSYVFKPSVALVPKPTVRESGMNAEVISSMRDHIFVWKSRVLETGSMVTIVPKDAKFLLIPYSRNMTGFRPTDKRRGYMLSKGPLTFSPGELGGTVGNFTNFWLAFWEGRGGTVMNESITHQIEQDFLPSMTKSTPKGLSAGFKQQVESYMRKTQAEAKIMARSR